MNTLCLLDFQTLQEVIFIIPNGDLHWLIKITCKSEWLFWDCFTFLILHPILTWFAADFIWFNKGLYSRQLAFSICPL